METTRKIALTIICGGIVALLLMLHDPTASSWWYSAQGLSSNTSRFLLNSCAAGLYVLLGGAAWAVPLFIWGYAYFIVRRTDQNSSICFLSIVASGLLIASMIDAYFSLSFQKGVTGGIIGSFCLSILRSWCGMGTDYYILLCLFVGYIFFLIGTGWIYPIKAIVRYWWRRWMIPFFQQLRCISYDLFTYMRALYYGPSSVESVVGPLQIPCPELIIEKASDQKSVPKTSPLAKKMGSSSSYQKPSLERILGIRTPSQRQTTNRSKEQTHILEDTLRQFGIQGTVTDVVIGPVVILYEYQPERGMPISKICAREHDIARALQATSLRIIAPIPGKSVVGFECARTDRDAVLFSDHWSQLFSSEAQLPLLLGVTTGGKPVIIDLATLPHLLVAGSTGSGKSVALNSMIVSLLSTLSPQDLRLILIDPKRLEFALYADLAHLLFPIVTDPREAMRVLRWAVCEMERRYELMSQIGVTHSIGYRAAGHDMPDIVIVIDEWADLMMTGGKDAEASLVRLAQMARAAGIHLIVATQRPSVDVITGLIKVNIPARLACRVISKVDSRTILDTAGAETLAGKGDMLVMMPGKSVERMHGVYVSNQEIQAITCAIRRQGGVSYIDTQKNGADLPDVATEDIELYKQVLELVRSTDEISISLLQRKLRIGYNRSARMIDYLEAHGMILPSDGGKMRKVLR